jgi:glutathionylspermidine synthase
MTGDYVVKPKLSREGANITVHRDGAVVQKTAGVYDENRAIYQAFSPLPDFDGFHPVLGAWVVGGKAAGLGIREERSLVTTNMSHFVPHYIAD